MLNFNNISIRKKLIGFFIVIILFISMTITFFSMKETQAAILEQSRKSILYSLDQAAEKSSFVLDSIQYSALLFTFNNDLKKVCLSMEDEIEADGVYALIRTMNLISVYNNINRYVHSVYIYDHRHQRMISSANGVFKLPDDPHTYEWYRSAFETRQKSIWLKTTDFSNYSSNTRLKAITLCSPVRDELSGSVIATVTINVLEDSLFRMFKDMKFSDTSALHIVDADGYVIASADKQLIGKTMEGEFLEGIAQNDASYVKSIKGTSYLLNYSRIETTGWYYLSVVPMKELIQKSIDTTGVVVLGVAVLTILLSILLSLGFNRHFFNPFLVLIDKLKDISREVPMKKRNSILSRNDEIGFIFREISNIVDQNNSLTRSIYEQKLLLVESELKLLYSQMNPHFLYNSLDAIKWLAQFNDHGSILLMVDALSRFFRLSLNKGADMITLNEEKSLLESYFTVQKIRFEDRLTIDIQFDKQILNCKILRLLLQPLVENSVKYGVEVKKGHSHISVYAKEEGGRLELGVADNGKGIAPEELAEINRMIHSVRSDEDRFSALHNINKRIQIHYGSCFGLRIASHEGAGTVVVMSLPLEFCQEETAC